MLPKVYSSSLYITVLTHNLWKFDEYLTFQTFLIIFEKSQTNVFNAENLP